MLAQGPSDPPGTIHPEPQAPVASQEPVSPSGVQVPSGDATVVDQGTGTEDQDAAPVVPGSSSDAQDSVVHRTQDETKQPIPPRLWPSLGADLQGSLRPSL